MANSKISEMTPATTIAGIELIPVVQEGVNKFVTPDLLKTIPEITYAQLSNLINASELITGKYAITDFATRHYLTDGLAEQAMTTDEIPVPAEVTGTTETIIVTATSANTIDKRVQSVQYPNDIIEYDWNPANWLDNINFAVDGVIISGFKGVITYRRDTIQNNSGGHDFRGALNRRWSIAQAEWSADPGTYNEGDFVQVTGEGSTKIYVALASAVGTDVPGTATTIWRELWDIIDTPYWSNNSTEMFIDNNTTIPVVDSSVFDDISTFGNAYSTVRNIHLPQGTVDYDGEAKAQIPNIVFHSKEGETFCDGTFGEDCMLMTFGNYIYNFSFGNGNYNFSFGNGNYNFSFGNYNYNFSFGNGNGNFSFGNGNYNFSFGNGNYNFSFGNYIYNFSFGNGNGNFSFGNGNYGFSGTLIQVTCGDGIDFSDIDFSAAYYIIQGYSKTIIQDSAGDVKLWYIDDAGVMQVKDVNAGEPI